MMHPKGTVKSRVMFIVGLFVLAAIIAFVILLIQNRSTGNSLDVFSDPNVTDTTNVNSDESVTPGPLDDDGDGLPNEQEATLGTDPANADSDGDGLFDYDEVSVYGSDPLDADSDGDGNPDGTEVKNGYSPVDDSKFLDLEREKSKLN